MPHERPRYFSPILKAEMRWAPSIGILGMRQVGKTTILQQFCEQYFSFDSQSVIADFEKAAESILDKGPYPVALDEVQKFPPLFHSIKLLIDRKKIPGRYLMTGSVRFSSKRNIRESLTGRISLLELLPFTIAESHARPLSPFLQLILKLDERKFMEAMQNHIWAHTHNIEDHLKVGGLPGICFKRDEKVRDKLFKNHLETLFGRDIHFVAETNFSITKLTLLFAMICEGQGAPLNYSHLAREVSSTPPTVKKAIDALESLFLLRRCGKTYFSEDLGIASFAMRFTKPPLRLQILRFVFSEVTALINYSMATDCQLGSFSTRGGIDIPFLLEHKNGKKVAIVVEGDEKASDKTLKSLVWFRKEHSNTKCIVFHRGDVAYLSNSRVLCLPWTWIC